MQISFEQLTPAFAALFDRNEPAGLRLCAALARDFPARFFVDNPKEPTWGIVQETEYGTIYIGGRMDAPLLHAMIGELQQFGEVLAGLWSDDPRAALLPPAPYQGVVVDCTDRAVGEGLAQYLVVPPGCEIVPIYRLPSDPHHEPQLKHFTLVRDGAVLCEAGVGPQVDGVIEVGVTTTEGHYGQGYATVTCAHLIQHCESIGYQTYWNCNKSNIASLKLARKLGYRQEKEYRLWAWEAAPKDL